MVYPMLGGPSPMTVPMGVGSAPIPSGGLRGSGPLAAALRETAARPMRYAPGRVPRIPYRGGSPLGKLPFGKLGGYLPEAADLGGLSPAGRRLLFRALGGVEGAFAFEIAMMFVPWGWNTTALHDMSGWTLLCKTPGPINTWTQAQNNPNLNCTIPFQVPGADWDILPTSRWVGYGGGQSRMNITEQWTRPAGGALLPFTGWPYPAPVDATRYPSPFPYPTANPFNALAPHRNPIMVPMPTPKPLPFKVIPHRQPDPALSPDEQSSGSQPSAPPAAAPDPAGKPSYLPAWEIILDRAPGGGIRPPVGKSGFHSRRPPTKREKESKKIFAIDSASNLGKLVNAVTESMDLLNVVYGSLDWKVRRKYHSPDPFEKLGIILWNLDAIRPGTLAADFLSNQLEDKGFGKLGKLQGRAARSAFEHGFAEPRPGLGPADTPPGAPGIQSTNPLDDWLGQNVYSRF